MTGRPASPRSIRRRGVPSAHDRAEDRQRGFIEAEDRFGQLRKFGIMSISLAAVHANPGDFHTHGEIASRAAELKQVAKSNQGSVLIQGGVEPKDEGKR